MTKSLSLLVAFAVALVATPALAGRGAGPVSGPQAKAHVIARLQYSSAVKDKSKPWRFMLGGKKGDKLRTFTANNERRFAIDPLTTGIRGNRVEGTLDTQTGKVRTTHVDDVGLFRNPPPLRHTTLPVQPRVLRAP